MPNSKTEPLFTFFNCPLQLGAILLLFSMPGILVASNWQWMRDTPVKSFDSQDWALLEKTINHMLDQGEDGDSEEWRNPETGNGGKVQIMGSMDTDKGVCRDLLITNRTKSNAGSTRLNYCRQPDAQWKIDPRPRQP